jgi:hypothetical protein
MKRWRWDGPKRRAVVRLRIDATLSPHVLLTGGTAID